MPDQQTKLKRCGTYTWFGFTLPFERKLALIAEAGFQTICTWWDDTFAGTDGRKEGHFRLA